MDDKFNKISDAVSSGIDKMADANSEKDYQRRSERVEANSNGGIVDSAGGAVQSFGEKEQAVGDKISSAASTGKTIGDIGSKTADVLDKTSEVSEKAFKTMQTSGKMKQDAAQAAKSASQTTGAISDAAIDAGAGASATGVGAIAGIPLAAVGAVGKAASVGTEAAANVAETTGKVEEEVGKVGEKASKNANNFSKKLKKSSENLKDASEKAEDFGDKLSERGKNTKNKGLSIREAANPEGSGDFVEDAVDAAKKTAKEVVKDIKDKKKVADEVTHAKISAEGIGAGFRIIARRIIIISVVVIILIAMIYEMALGPLMEAMDRIDQTSTDAANFYEKMDNYLSGLGFQDSEQAFHDELDNLNTRYHKELDIPFIMATLFFDDIQNNGETSDFGIETGVTGDGDGVYGEYVLGSAYAFLKDKLDEAQTTTGNDGLIYSSNKVYRLRKLAKHSLATGLFGQPEKSSESDAITLEEYINMCSEQLGNELVQFLEDIPGLILDAPIRNVIESLIKILGGNEIISTTDLGNSSLKEAIDIFYNIIKQVLWSTWMDVTWVGSCDNNLLEICVKYKTYERDEASYKAYLKQYYIRHMPEFKKYINDTNDEALEKSIDKVIEEIEEIKEQYEEIFKVQEQNTEYYSNICTGNIKKVLLNELVKPVDIDPNQEICFSGAYGFGTSGGLQHKGVDINENTTGNHEGDSVYSIYSNGKIVKSSKDSEDSEESSPSGNVGYIEIEYDAQLSDGAYKFKAVYEGLDPSSVELKTGDTVQKGDKIGVIGGTPEAGISIPSLHFGIYDINSSQYLDPTNLFVDCGDGPSIGNGSEEDLWKYLKNYGLSDAGAAGVLGNWVNESGYRSNNLEDGCERQTEYDDVSFTEAVNTGKITLAQWKNYPGFTCEGSSGIFGYGLAQWTFDSRKEDLWNFWKESGTTIDDLTMQLEFFKKEVETGYDFRGLLDYLKTATDPREAALRFREKYEIGEGITVRADSAEQIYNKYKGTSGSSSTSNNTTSSNPSCYDPGDNITISSLDNFFFIGDSRYGNQTGNGSMNEKLKKLGTEVNVQAVVGSSPSEWKNSIQNNTPIKGATIIYPASDKVSGISVMLGVNNPSQDGDMATFLNNLHEKYPNVQIFVNSVYHIGKKYRDGYVNNSQIEAFNTKMKSFCNGKKWATYIDVTSGLHNSDGNLVDKYTGDGLHLNGDGEDILVKNIKEKILSSSVSVDNATREKLVDTAKQSLGVSYSYNARENPETELRSGVDCSGFMWAVYKVNGIDIPTVEQRQAQSSNMKKVYDIKTQGAFNDSVLPKMKKGDLIFIANDSAITDKCYNEIGHVGMYIGNGQMIHASYDYKKVVIVNIKDYGYSRVRQVSTWNGNPKYNNSIDSSCRCVHKCW